MSDELEQRIETLEAEIKTLRQNVSTLAKSIVDTHKSIIPVAEISMDTIQEVNLLLGIAIRDCLKQDQQAINDLLFKLEKHLETREENGQIPAHVELTRGFLAVLRSEALRPLS